MPSFCTLSTLSSEYNSINLEIHRIVSESEIITVDFTLILVGTYKFTLNLLNVAVERPCHVHYTTNEV